MNAIWTAAHLMSSSFLSPPMIVRVRCPLYTSFCETLDFQKAVELTSRKLMRMLPCIVTFGLG